MFHILQLRIIHEYSISLCNECSKWSKWEWLSLQLSEWNCRQSASEIPKFSSSKQTRYSPYLFWTKWFLRRIEFDTTKMRLKIQCYFTLIGYYTRIVFYISGLENESKYYRKSFNYYSKYSSWRAIHFCIHFNHLSKHFCHSNGGISRTCILYAANVWGVGNKKKSFGVEWGLIKSTFECSKMQFLCFDASRSWTFLLTYEHEPFLCDSHNIWDLTRTNFLMVNCSCDIEGMLIPFMP